jgi:hypothetical protein
LSHDNSLDSALSVIGAPVRLQSARRIRAVPQTWARSRELADPPACLGGNLGCPGGVPLWLHDCSGVIVHGGFHGSAVDGAALSTAAAAKMPASKSFITLCPTAIWCSSPSAVNQHSRSAIGLTSLVVMLFPCPPVANRLSQYTPEDRHGDATEDERIWLARLKAQTQGPIPGLISILRNQSAADRPAASITGVNRCPSTRTAQCRRIVA